MTKEFKNVVYDSQWFGNFWPHKNLKVIKGDINQLIINLKNINTVIHLANIANDPDLNPNLSWEVNVLSLRYIK